MYVNSLFAYCKPCPVDTFWPKPAERGVAVYHCTPCPEGEHQPRTGQTFCQRPGESQVSAARHHHAQVPQPQRLPYAVQAFAYLSNVDQTDMSTAWLKELEAAVASVTGGHASDVVAKDIEPYGMWDRHHPDDPHGMRLKLEQRSASRAESQGVLAILKMADFTSILKRHMMNNGNWLPDDVGFAIKHPHVKLEDVAKRHAAKSRLATGVVDAVEHSLRGAKARRRADDDDDDDAAASSSSSSSRGEQRLGDGHSASEVVHFVVVAAIALFGFIVWLERRSKARLLRNPYQPVAVHEKL